MQRHPFFDLRLHDDDELAALLQDEVRERLTLHEWPLSCVQKVTTAQGRAVIYKSQYGPTVEPEFYATARSPLLVSARTLYRSEGHACMVLDYLEGSGLADLSWPVKKIMEVGQTIMAQIAGIEGDPPHWLDVSGQRQWGKVVEDLVRDLTTLVHQGRFWKVTPAMVCRLEQRAFSQSVLAALRRVPGTVHGDLGGDNVFSLSDGYRVIDWQRPIRGPAELDLAVLVQSLGHDPWRYVDPGIVRLLFLLQVHWLVQCAVHWFPAGTETYDTTVARLIADLDGPDS
jgi:hypothetical protein